MARYGVFIRFDVEADDKEEAKEKIEDTLAYYGIIHHSEVYEIEEA